MYLSTVGIYVIAGKKNVGCTSDCNIIAEDIIVSHLTFRPGTVLCSGNPREERASRDELTAFLRLALAAFQQ